MRKPVDLFDPCDFLPQAFLLGGIILFAFLSPSAQARSIYSERYLWKDFRLSHQSMLQEAGQVFTGALTYTPSVRLTRRNWLGVDFGISVARFSHDPLFPALEYGLHGFHYFQSWLAVDASLGLQNWLNNGGNFFYGGVGLTFRLNRQILRFVQQFFAHYTYVNSFPRQVHQIRLGVGLTL